MVVNPFASELSFPDSCTRTRRDHEKYLSLIRAVTLLHQKQRPRRVKVESGREIAYVEVTEGDVALANRLAREILGRTLDELPPQTRRLLLLVEELVAKECERLGLAFEDFRFTRRWLREETGWGDTQLKVHLARLVDLEYLVVHTGAAHAQRHHYELLYDGSGEGGEAFVPGLIDVATLGTESRSRAGSGSGSTDMTANRSGSNGNRSAPGRPLVGGWSGGGRIEVSPEESEGYSQNRPYSPKNAHRGSPQNGPSYLDSLRTRRCGEDAEKAPEPALAHAGAAGDAEDL